MWRSEISTSYSQRFSSSPPTFSTAELTLSFHFRRMSLGPPQWLLSQVSALCSKAGNTVHVPSGHFLAVTPFARLSSNSPGPTWKGPVTAKCQVLQSGLSPSVLGPNSAPPGTSAPSLHSSTFQTRLPGNPACLPLCPCFQGGLSFLLGLSHPFECWRLWSSYLGLCLQLNSQISLPTFMMTTFKKQLFSEPYVLHF